MQSAHREKYKFETCDKEQKVGLPDDIKCGIIMVKLIEKIKLPSVGPDGNPISYKFIHKVTGRQLLETQTLAEAGIKDGDVLRLQPEITAGAFCPKCGNFEAEGNAFCSKCGSGIVQNQTGSQSGFSQVQFARPYRDDKRSKTVMILGIISTVLFLLSNIFLHLGDINHDGIINCDNSLYSFFYFLYYASEGVFMLVVTLYMTYKLKK